MKHCKKCIYCEQLTNALTKKLTNYYGCNGKKKSFVLSKERMEDDCEQYKEREVENV